MKFRLVSLLIILSLLTVAIFGMWGMTLDSHTTHNSCPISALTLGDCPEVDLAVYNNHLSILGYFAQGGVNLSQLGLLAAALALLVTAFLALTATNYNLSSFKYQVVRNYKLKSSHWKRFFYWLAHTHSRIQVRLFRVYETT